jgi:hypothetical protein
MDVGAPAILPLARTAASQPPAALKLGGEAPWKRPVLLLLAIDQKAAVGALVGMLGDPACAAQEATVIAILGDVTVARFQYNPQGSTEEKQATIKKWQDWWKAQGETK